MFEFFKCFRPNSDNPLEFPAFLEELNHFLSTNEVLYAVLYLQNGSESTEVRMYSTQTVIIQAGRRMFNNIFPFEKLCHHHNQADVSNAIIVIQRTGDIDYYKSKFSKFSKSRLKVDLIHSE